MSRIGLQPVTIPSGVTVEVQGHSVSVKGPKGDLQWEHHPDMTVALEGDAVVVTRPTDAKRHRALHGLTRSIISNMVQGCHEGYSRNLKIVGTGWNAKAGGNNLTLNIGFCHPVVMEVPQGLDVQTPAPAEITVQGADKQVVGQFAANVRRVRPPEPYNGKGIMYADEIIRRKQGKSFVGGAE